MVLEVGFDTPSRGRGPSFERVGRRGGHRRRNATAAALAALGVLAIFFATAGDTPVPQPDPLPEATPGPTQVTIKETARLVEEIPLSPAVELGAAEPLALVFHDGSYYLFAVDRAADTLAAPATMTWASADARRWRRVDSDLPAGVHIDAVASSPFGLVAAGEQDDTPTLWVSSDGAAWDAYALHEPTDAATWAVADLAVGADGVVVLARTTTQDVDVSRYHLPDEVAAVVEEYPDALEVGRGTSGWVELLGPFGIRLGWFDVGTAAGDVPIDRRDPDGAGHLFRWRPGEPVIELELPRSDIESVSTVDGSLIVAGYGGPEAAIQASPDGGDSWEPMVGPAMPDADLGGRAVALEGFGPRLSLDVWPLDRTTTQHVDLRPVVAADDRIVSWRLAGSGHALLLLLGSALPQGPPGPPATSTLVGDDGELTISSDPNTWSFSTTVDGETLRIWASDGFVTDFRARTVTVVDHDIALMTFDLATLVDLERAMAADAPNRSSEVIGTALVSDDGTSWSPIDLSDTADTILVVATDELVVVAGRVLAEGSALTIWSGPRP